MQTILGIFFALGALAIFGLGVRLWAITVVERHRKAAAIAEQLDAQLRGFGSTAAQLAYYRHQKYIAQFHLDLARDHLKACGFRAGDQENVPA